MQIGGALARGFRRPSSVPTRPGPVASRRRRPLGPALSPVVGGARPTRPAVGRRRRPPGSAWPGPTVGPTGSRRLTGLPDRHARGHEATPRAPARARLPLLPSSPGGVQRDDTARGVASSVAPETAWSRGGVRHPASRRGPDADRRSHNDRITAAPRRSRRAASIRYIPSHLLVTYGTRRADRDDATRGQGADRCL